MGLLCFFLSCVCYAFVRVCLYVHCGHLLGKGRPLGSRLWCLTVSLSLSHWCSGSGVVLNVSIPDFCTLTYCEAKTRRLLFFLRWECIQNVYSSYFCLQKGLNGIWKWVGSQYPVRTFVPFLLVSDHVGQILTQ